MPLALLGLMRHSVSRWASGVALTLMIAAGCAQEIINTTVCLNDGVFVTLVFTPSGTYGSKLLNAGQPMDLVNVSVDEAFLVNTSTRMTNGSLFVLSLEEVLPESVLTNDVSVAYPIAGDTILINSSGTVIIFSRSQCEACVATVLGAAFSISGPWVLPPCQFCWLSQSNTLLQQTLHLNGTLKAVISVLNQQGTLTNHLATNEAVPLRSADFFPVIANATIMASFFANSVLGASITASFFNGARASSGVCELPTAVSRASWCNYHGGYFVSAWVNSSGIAAFVTNKLTAGSSLSDAEGQSIVAPDIIFSLLSMGKEVMVNYKLLISSVFLTHLWKVEVLGFEATEVTFDETAATGIMINGNDDSVAFLHSACDDQLIQALTGTSPISTLDSYCYIDEGFNTFSLNVSGGKAPMVRAMVNGATFFYGVPNFIFNATALLGSLIGANLPSVRELPSLRNVACSEVNLQPVGGVFCSIIDQQFTTLSLGSYAQVLVRWNGKKTSISASNLSSPWLAIDGEEEGTKILVNSSGFLEVFGNELGLSAASQCKVTLTSDSELTVLCSTGEAVTLHSAVCDPTVSPLVRAVVDNARHNSIETCSIDQFAWIPVMVSIEAPTGALLMTAATMGSHGIVTEGPVTVPLVANLTILTQACLMAQPLLFPTASQVLASKYTAQVECSHVLTEAVAPSTFCGRLPTAISAANTSMYWTFANSSGELEGGVVVAVVDTASGLASASTSSARFMLTVLPAFGGMVVNQTWFSETFGPAFGVSLKDVKFTKDNTTSTFDSLNMRVVLRNGSQSPYFDAVQLLCDPCLVSAMLNRNNASNSSRPGDCQACLWSAPQKAIFSSVMNQSLSKFLVEMNFNGIELEVPLVALPPSVSVLSNSVNIYDWVTLGYFVLGVLPISKPTMLETVSCSSAIPLHASNSSFCLTQTSAMGDRSSAALLATDTSITLSCNREPFNGISGRVASTAFDEPLVSLPSQGNVVLNSETMVELFSHLLYPCLFGDEFDSFVFVNGSITLHTTTESAAPNRNITLQWWANVSARDELPFFFMVAFQEGECNGCLSFAVMLPFASANVTSGLEDRSIGTNSDGPNNCSFCYLHPPTKNFFVFNLDVLIDSENHHSPQVRWNLTFFNSSLDSPFLISSTESTTLPLIPMPDVLLRFILNNLDSQYGAEMDLQLASCDLGTQILQRVPGTLCGNVGLSEKVTLTFAPEWQRSQIGFPSVTMTVVNISTQSNPSMIQNSSKRAMAGYEVTEYADGAVRVLTSQTSFSITMVNDEVMNQNLMIDMLLASGVVSNSTPPTLWTVNVTLGIDNSGEVYVGRFAVLSGASVVMTLMASGCDPMLTTLPLQRSSLSPPSNNGSGRVESLCLFSSEYSLVEMEVIAPNLTAGSAIQWWRFTFNAELTLSVALVINGSTNQGDSATLVLAFLMTCQYEALFVVLHTIVPLIEEGGIIIATVSVSCLSNFTALCDLPASQIIHRTFGGGILMWAHPTFLCNLVTITTYGSTAPLSSLPNTSMVYPRDPSVATKIGSVTLYPAEPQWSFDSNAMSRSPVLITVWQNASPECRDAVITPNVTVQHLPNAWTVIRPVSTSDWVSGAVPEISSAEGTIAGLILNQSWLRSSSVAQLAGLPNSGRSMWFAAALSHSQSVVSVAYFSTASGELFPTGCDIPYNNLTVLLDGVNQQDANSTTSLPSPCLSKLFSNPVPPSDVNASFTSHVVASCTTCFATSPGSQDLSITTISYSVLEYSSSFINPFLTVEISLNGYSYGRKLINFSSKVAELNVSSALATVSGWSVPLIPVSSSWASVVISGDYSAILKQSLIDLTNVSDEPLKFASANCEDEVPMPEVMYCGWFVEKRSEEAAPTRWTFLNIFGSSTTLMPFAGDAGIFLPADTVIMTSVSTEFPGMFPFQQATLAATVRSAAILQSLFTAFNSSNDTSQEFAHVKSSSLLIGSVESALPQPWDTLTYTMSLRRRWSDNTEGSLAFMPFPTTNLTNVTFTEGSCDACLVNLLRSLQQRSLFEAHWQANSAPEASSCVYLLIAAGSLEMLDLTIELPASPALDIRAVLRKVTPNISREGVSFHAPSVLMDGSLGNVSQVPHLADPIALLFAANSTNNMTWYHAPTFSERSATTSSIAVVPVPISGTLPNMTWEEVTNSTLMPIASWAPRAALCAGGLGSSGHDAIFVTIIAASNSTKIRSRYARYGQTTNIPEVADKDFSTIVPLNVSQLSEQLLQGLKSTASNGGASTSDMLALLGVLASPLVQSGDLFLLSSQNSFHEIFSLPSPLTVPIGGSLRPVVVNASTSVALCTLSNDDGKSRRMTSLAFVSIDATASGAPVGTILLNLTDGNSPNCSACLLSTFNANSTVNASCVAPLYFLSPVEALFYQLAPQPDVTIVSKLLPEDNNDAYSSSPVFVTNIPMTIDPWFDDSTLGLVASQVPQVTAFTNTMQATDNPQYHIVVPAFFCFAYANTEWVLGWQGSASSNIAGGANTSTVTLTRFTTPSNTNVLQSSYDHALAWIQTSNGELLADVLGMFAALNQTFPETTLSGAPFGSASSGGYSNVQAKGLHS